MDFSMDHKGNGYFFLETAQRKLEESPCLLEEVISMKALIATCLHYLPVLGIYL